MAFHLSIPLPFFARATTSLRATLLAVYFVLLAKLKHPARNMSASTRFQPHTSVKVRVEVMAPIINAKIEKFEVGEAEGVEIFQERLLGEIFDAGLMEKDVWLDVSVVAPHPDNREKVMLVPVDAHDLLFNMVHNGWSWKKWDALVCEVPPTELGVQWVKKSNELVDGAGGLLPQYDSDRIKGLTGRGSHGTAACRIVKLGARGVHKDLCDDQGNVSASKIYEMQPSMQEPITKGCPYDVIKWELVAACPKLMGALSRMGNASHNVFRIQTTLQHCARIHNLATATNHVDWDVIAKKACIGMGPEFIGSAKLICEFVRAWSGGQDGRILRDLEGYERSLAVKRKLYPQDLAEIGRLDAIDIAKYIPALVKTLLNAPTCDASGHADLFNKTDYVSVQPGAKNRPFAKEAGALIERAEIFLTAYSRLTPPQILKVTSDMSVRLVMHVHQKKCDTRTSYSSQKAIARQMYIEAQKIDDKLPQWNVLKDVKDESNGDGKSDNKRVLREVRSDGKIPDSELNDRGFKVGKLIAKRDDVNVVYEIKTFGTNLDVIVVKEVKPNPKGKESTMDRVVVCRDYAVHAPTTEIVWTPKDRNPMMHIDLKCAIVVGKVKNEMMDAFKKSTESLVNVAQEPKVACKAIKAISVEACKLVCLTNNVSVVKGCAGTVPNATNTTILLGTAFHLQNDTPMIIVAKSHMTFPPKQTHKSGFARSLPIDPFLAAYWSVAETSENDKVNCEVRNQEVTIV